MEFAGLKEGALTNINHIYDAVSRSQISAVLYSYLFILSLTSCSDSDPDTSRSVNQVYASAESVSMINNAKVNRYEVLFLGNSHIAKIPELITAFVDGQASAKSIETHDTPNFSFLDEKLKDLSTVNLLENNSWTHVVLQGQKYSQSGIYDYSTAETKEWIRKTKAKQATPVLYPEHPQIGDVGEGIRVLNLHREIASDESSCVAPVGAAWKRVMEQHPDINLHSPDGNHANLTGQFLTAMVLYEVITGESADMLPYIETIDIAPEVQDLFGQVVTDLMFNTEACPENGE